VALRYGLVTGVDNSFEASRALLWLGEVRQLSIRMVTQGSENATSSILRHAFLCIQVSKQAVEALRASQRLRDHSGQLAVG
jgi:hypothetical protein